MDHVKHELLASMDHPEPAIAGGLMAASLPAAAPTLMMEDTLPTCYGWRLPSFA